MAERHPTRHLYIDSRNRNARKFSSTRFEVELDNPFDLSKYTEYRVQSIEIPVTWYTVQESNRAFYYSLDGGISYTRIVLPAQNYVTIRAILNDISVIASNMQATDITLSYQPLTGRCRVIVSNNMTPELFRIKTMPDSILTIGFPLAVTIGDSREFAPDMSLFFPFDALDSPNVVQLDFRSHIFVTSGVLAGMTEGTVRVASSGLNDVGDVILKLQMGDNTFRNTVQRDNTIGEWSRLAKGTNGMMQNFDIGLRFPQNIPVVDLHGGEWSCTIAFR